MPSYGKEPFIMDILGTIKEILAKQLRVDIDTIDENTNIVSDLGADSLDVVEMLMTIEEEYGISVPDDVVVTFVTVGDVAAYVENNQ
jgi:acyl carrier protein